MLKRLLCAGALIALAPATSWAQSVGGYDSGVPIAPVVQTAAYVASNSLGGLQTLSVFRNPSQFSGIIDNFVLSWASGLTTAVTVYIYDANPSATTCTDKVAFSEAAADAPKRAMAPFSITPATSQGATAASGQQSMVISVANRDTTPTRNLYVCLVAGAGVTPGSTTDLSGKLGVVLD